MTLITNDERLKASKVDSASGTCDGRGCGVCVRVHHEGATALAVVHTFSGARVSGNDGGADGDLWDHGFLVGDLSLQDNATHHA